MIATTKIHRRTCTKRIQYLLSEEYMDRHAALPITETLYEGQHYNIAFKQFKRAMVKELGQPSQKIDGNPPYNQGAIYLFWKRDDHTVALNLRGNSHHFRSQDVTPFVEFNIYDQPPLPLGTSHEPP